MSDRAKIPACCFPPPGAESSLPDGTATIGLRCVRDARVGSKRHPGRDAPAPASGKVIRQAAPFRICRLGATTSDLPRFPLLSRFSPLPAKRFVGALPQFPEILDVVALSFVGRSRRSAECERRRCVAKKRSGLRPSSIPLSLPEPLRSAFSVSRVSRYSPRISSCRRKSFRGRCPSAFPASGSTRFSCPARVRQMRCPPVAGDIKIGRSDPSDPAPD